jgi:hypothetical protein
MARPFTKRNNGHADCTTFFHNDGRPPTVVAGVAEPEVMVLVTFAQGVEVYEPKGRNYAIGRECFFLRNQPWSTKL